MRAANAKFAKKEEQKRGKSQAELKVKSKKGDSKLPISVGWVCKFSFALSLIELWGGRNREKEKRGILC